MTAELKVGSLFAGIGGFDLAAEWVGWRTVWVSEIEPFASKTLGVLFPEAINHGDITKIDFTKVEPIDVLCGGFPCQDISNAGKGVGIDGERSGLWREYRRAICELRPRYVVVENVSALLARGLDRVLGDLAALGYDAEWHCITASAVGAPHRRDRVWIVAYPNASGRDRDRGWGALPAAGRATSELADPQGERCAEARGLRRDESAERSPRPGEALAHADRAGLPQGDEGLAGASPEQPHGGRLLRATDDVPDPDLAGLEGGVQRARADQEGREVTSLRESAQRGIEWARERNRGWWATEPDVGRVAYGVPARMDRLRCLGNAIVPQVVEVIFRAIIEREAILAAGRGGD